MPDAASVSTSSVVPGDSVSSRGGKKKPGKRERQEARAVRTGSSNPASAAKASLFSAGAHSDPVPQPGKFPVVFQTGAGEPSRDRAFSYAPQSLSAILTDLFSKFSSNDKFAEFKANSDLTTQQFELFVKLSFVIGLAQQTVHAHVNMGLPLGDFSPMNSTNVECFSSLRAVLAQFGEFSVPALGTRFLLYDYAAEVRKLVRLGRDILAGRGYAALARYWLPTSPSDGATKVAIGEGLKTWLLEAHAISIPGTELEDSVFSGDVPDVWEHIKPLLGPDPGTGAVDTRDRFDFLFKSYPDEGQFTVAFSTVAATSCLADIGLVWKDPSAGHLSWGVNVKEDFSVLSDRWQKMVPSFGKFFTMVSGAVNRTIACGSASQLSSVRTSDGITVVKTVVALAAPEFSLLACFPASALVPGYSERLVVLTTPLNVAQRATEFCQLDWK